MQLKRRTIWQISLITVIRVIMSTGFRMVFPFQPYIMEGLGIELKHIARLASGQSAIGIISPFIATVADRRGRKAGMLAGLLFFSLGLLIVVFYPTVIGFTFFLLFSSLGKFVFDPSAQAYFSDRVPYRNRGLLFGLTEMSWSAAFFLGVPIMGVLISRSGWSSPFNLLAFLGGISLLSIFIIIPGEGTSSGSGPALFQNIRNVILTPAALAAFGVTFFICMGNQIINLTFGVWLEETFAFQAAALGGASALIGISELVGEGGVSLIADILTKKRSVFWGLVTNGVVAVFLPFLGRMQFGALAGLFLYYLTFEFTIVCMIPLMSGILPASRTTVMAMFVASASLGRVFSGLFTASLYGRGFVVSSFVVGGLSIFALIAHHFIVVQEDQ
ncbi:MAG: MFS transporter [Anaerolineales bacterium]